MNNFPLYDVLISENSKSNTTKDLTVAQKTSLVKKIAGLDNDGFETIAIIIKIFEQREKNEKSCVFPYDGKITNNGLTSNIDIDLLTLPIKLRHMLYKFVEMHYNKMENDKSMEEH